MKNNRLVFAALSVAAAATLLALAVAREPSSSESEVARVFAQPAPGPAWELKDVNGKLMKSSEFSGKVVILDFWATWCGPCRLEIPSFVELQKQYADKGLVVVGVSLDQDGTAAVKAFMGKMGINYPVVVGDESIVTAFGGIEAIPTTFIIDREGRIVRKHIGFTPKTELEAEIQSLLKV